MRDILIGQQVRLTADLYGGRVVYRGTVIGQQAGTSSAFSLLPAQNATGNWIKVTQRVPVRIALDAAHLFGLGVFFFAYLMLGANNYMVPVLLQRTLGFAWQTVGNVEALGLLFTLLTWLTMSRLLPHYPSPRKYMLASLQHALGAAVPFGDTAHMAVARVAQMTAQQAALLADIDHFSAIAALGVLGIAVGLWQKVFR